ncbi:MAG: radical SAM protein [Planctomycetes bacterium]|nr:radical SAM protein [Planctomycetota bacterium]
MLDVTKLLCGVATPGDQLRYGESSAGCEGTDAAADRRRLRDGRERRPVVVWNCTRRCNLRCIHCYAGSDGGAAPNELTGDEARRMLDDLAAFKVPALLMSGGEPLLREDLMELARYARDGGMRPTLSTNGTLITAAVAREIQRAGFTYVGISLDGIGEVNDRFRGAAGAFEKAVAGFRHLRDLGQRVGLRLTLTRQTACDLEAIFDFLEAEGVDRACFYHLVYTGRAGGMTGEDLPWAATRRALDTIFRRTRDLVARGLHKDILTVDNHVDGVYLYQSLLRSDPERAGEVRRLLAWNGGAAASTGVGIGCIDFVGDVHPNQFWSHYRLGNVRQRPFSEIWSDSREPLLAGLRNRLPLLKGRCGVCRFKDLCGGGSRVRAEFVFRDTWAPEPACYLSDEEIGLEASDRERLAARGEWFEMPASLRRLD